jgi:hypothetical protein
MRLVKNTSEFVCEGISREDYLRKEDPLWMRAVPSHSLRAQSDGGKWESQVAQSFFSLLPNCHDVNSSTLPYFLLQNGLKFLKLWSKINLSCLKLFYSGT